MRILLVHNPEAGDGESTRQRLKERLVQAGHKPIYRSAKKKGWKRALKKKLDLVLVAGGDGTVGKVAEKLIGTGLPFSVLPLGTANNLARTLGFKQSQEQLIAGLARGKRADFDVGLARGPWGKRYFFEGVGAGLFADYLYERKVSPAKEERGTKAEQMKRHVKELRRWLRKHRAQEWKIELDGKDYSGRYLLWQAMNIRSVGPVLRMAAAARLDDGAFDFVGAREEDRELLLDYLSARLKGSNARFPLRARRFKKMRLRWVKESLHFDDALWSAEDEKWPKRCKIEIAVKEKALGIWKSKK